MTQTHTAERTEPRHCIQLYRAKGMWWRQFTDGEFDRLIGGAIPTCLSERFPEEMVVAKTRRLFPNAVITVESTS